MLQKPNLGLQEGLELPEQVMEFLPLNGASDSGVWPGGMHLWLQGAISRQTSALEAHGNPSSRTHGVIPTGHIHQPLRPTSPG